MVRSDFTSKAQKYARIQASITGRIYQLAIIAIAALIFSSCQKEVNTPAPSNTSITASNNASATASLQTMYWTVSGVQREATVYIPSTSGYHPIVFGFHGSGGTG